MMACGAPAPENMGRCILSDGHTGLHWNAGGSWGVRPQRKAAGSEPMHGTLADVLELRRNVREVAIQLIREGAQLR